MDRDDLYKLHVEECRFQVDLNWRRSQYFFALNVVILVAGIGLLGAGCVPAGLMVLPFIVGVVSCAGSIFLNETQHRYYRTARDRKMRVADSLELGDFAIASTPGSGSGGSRRIRVTTVQYLILGVIGVADVVAALYVLFGDYCPVH